MKLIYKIISNTLYTKTIIASPKLTLDYNNYRLDILDRYSQLYTSTLLVDEGFLFFNYIYSTIYNIVPKRYLISFAITRDFFYSFFSIAIDNLDRQPYL